MSPSDSCNRSWFEPRDPGVGRDRRQRSGGCRRPLHPSPPCASSSPTLLPGARQTGSNPRPASSPGIPVTARPNPRAFYAGARIAETVGLDLDDVRLSARKGILQIYDKGEPVSARFRSTPRGRTPTTNPHRTETSEHQLSQRRAAQRQASLRARFAPAASSSASVVASVTERRLIRDAVSRSI